MLLIAFVPTAPRIGRVSVRAKMAVGRVGKALFKDKWIHAVWCLTVGVGLLCGSLTGNIAVKLVWRRWLDCCSLVLSGGYPSPF